MSLAQLPIRLLLCRLVLLYGTFLESDIILGGLALTREENGEKISKN